MASVDPQVIVLLGSKSDAEHRNAITQALDKLGITHVTRIASAHKVTSYLLDLLRGYEEDGQPHVFITVAGRSNALSGVVDANSRHPVIACPPYGDRFGGMDLLSTVRMPGGVAPLLVLEPAAAALAAAKILGIGAPAISQRVAELQERTRQQAIADDEAAQES
ncbi:MAG: AIR carboxylase family protein [Thermomicrobiales bacterium]|nr:AIR carboxylase family protein [Thermomicrobiales bacterium]MCA9876870.1 AIR carboxylase family protein [Thermomicrobiales bacterium]